VGIAVESATSTKALRDVVEAGIDRLGRDGRSHMLYTAPPDGEEVVPALELLSIENLRRAGERAVTAWSAHPSEEDMRAAISRFWRRYTHCLGLPLLLPVVSGVALDFSLARTSIVMKAATASEKVADMPGGLVVELDGAEVFTCEERPTSSNIVGTRLRTARELRERAIATIMRDHFAAAIERILRFVKVSPNMLWGQVAEAVDLEYEYIVDRFSPEEYAPFAEDRQRILLGETLPGIDGPSPLAGQLEWETIPGFKRPRHVRKVCCINYVVPGRPEPYCRSCGIISRDERLMIWGRYAATPGAQVYLIKPGPKA
jgi:hypothetical protein